MGERQPWWYSLFAICVSVAIVAGGGVWYVKKTTDKAVHDSQRNWCEVVSTLDQTYSQTPPQTESGRKVAIEIHKLRIKFDCPA